MYGSFSTIARMFSCSVSTAFFVRCVGIFEKHAGERFGEGGALVRYSFPVERVVCVPHDDIGVRLSAVNAENLTEAGLLRLVASKRHDGAVLASCAVERIDRLSEEDLIEDLNALNVAGLHAERDEVLVCKRLRLNGELVLFFFDQSVSLCGKNMSFGDFTVLSVSMSALQPSNHAAKLT